MKNKHYVQLTLLAIQFGCLIAQLNHIGLPYTSIFAQLGFVPIILIGML